MQKYTEFRHPRALGEGQTHQRYTYLYLYCNSVANSSMTKARQQAGQRVHLPNHSSKHALPTALPAVPKHVVWGSGRVCLTLLSHPQQSARVRNRPQPFATFRERSRWFCCGRAYGECCKSGHFWRFQTSCNVVSCGRRGTLWHSDVFHNVSKIVLFDRRETFASFSGDDINFSRQAQHFGCAHLRGRHCALDVSCCVLFANRNAPVKWWHLKTTFYTLHFTLRTVHFSPGTSHFRILTSYPTHYVHFPLNTPLSLHSTGSTPPHSPLHSLPRSTVYRALHLALYTTLHTLHLALHTVHFTLQTLHCTLHSTLYTTVYASRFTLDTLHSTLYTLNFKHLRCKP